MTDTDRAFLAEHEELSKRFGGGEGPWIDGTPEGNKLWALSHGGPTLVSIWLSDAKPRVLNLAGEWHLQGTPTDVIPFWLDGVKTRKAFFLMKTSRGQFLASASTSPLYVGEVQKLGKLNPAAANPVPPRKRPLAAVSL
jgi:hypothetical protein